MNFLSRKIGVHGECSFLVKSTVINMSSRDVSGCQSDTPQTGTKIFPRHGYDQFHLNGEWVSMAATFDKELCLTNGLPTVEFDGSHDAILPATDLTGNLYIEYMEVYQPQADLPLEWITRETSRIWGAEKRSWLNKKDYHDYKLPAT